jgi:hypothetical protein
MVDFGMTAKVRPALLPTGAPADDELDREKKLGVLTADELTRVRDALALRLVI